MLLAASAGGFEHIGVATLVVLGIVSPFSLAVAFWSTGMGARRVGVSGKALAGAVIGTFAGMFFGIIGVFAGPFVGAVAGELLHLRSLDRRGIGRAAKVGAGTWVGVVVAVGLKLMLAFAMIGIFLLAWLLP